MSSTNRYHGTNGSSSRDVPRVHLELILLSFTQKFSWLQMASAKKVLTPTLGTENTTDDSFEYVPPKVSLLAT